MVDSAYPNTTGYLAPYSGKSVRYHIPEFISGRRCGHGPQGIQELFNYRHSSLRGVVERTFGVVKATWKILDDRMPQMSLDSQIAIVIAVCTLHNFVRLHEKGMQISPRPLCSDPTPAVKLFDQDAKNVMKEIRNQIANDIWASHST